ncbi:PilZ domain-containing protein [Bradyrhizobium japonicum]|uniref:PilZ domain-containing protein n=1 Tax=Bradyrhizobium japonicum TaxID=375 RepID=UPI0027154B5D|nr:PilZ domain-containing protein [Bradyrhizobium japonicum]WLB23991.1 PilZ domain-containing protein [Bradyrhizobium japonicum]
MVDSRRANRVVFDHKPAATLLGSDGTWRRSCVLLDVSQTGAKLQIEGSTDVLNSKEFFLVLSTTGLAYRRCQLIWVDGDNVGVNFLVSDGRKPKPKSQLDREQR